MSFIDTRTLGSSTPSFATARAGGSVGKNFAYASLRPAKSLGLASSTWTSTTFSSFAPCGTPNVFAVHEGLARLLLDRRSGQLVRLGIDPNDSRHIYGRPDFDCLTE